MGHNGREQHAEEVGKHMPEEPIRVARFDHVTDRGDLVFVFDHRHFAVRIDDTLERGLMEAKQIKAEAQGIVQPQASSALPISSIQSYIRAGMDTARVAKQFSVNEAIVRRFSSPVETEKKYAIEQFLSVAAPKKTKARNNGELIEASLRNARINPSAIIWTATRRDHEPWHIHAKFEAAGRMIKADWSWDMHDNSVSSLNSTAKRLLGEGETRQDILPTSMRQALNGRGPLPYEWMDDELSNAEATESEIPPVVREELHTYSSGIAAKRQYAPPQAPAEQSASAQSSATRPESARSETARSESAQPSSASNQTSATHSRPSATEGTEPSKTAGDTSTGAAAGKGTGELTGWLYGRSKRQPAAARQRPGTVDTTSPTPRNSEEVSRQEPASGSDDAHKGKEHPTANRKSGRSAVPSWDEILFGD